MAAYNYIVPQLRVFQEFASSEAVTTAPMQVCIVAPRYIVLDGVFEDSFVGEYKKGDAFAISYPSIGAGNKVDDTGAVRVFLHDAWVERHTEAYSSDSGPEISGNSVTFDSVMTARLGEDPDWDFRVGDRLELQEGGEVKQYTITGFSADGKTVYVNKTIDAGPSGTLALFSFGSIEVTGEAGVIPGPTMLELPADLKTDGDPVESGSVAVALKALDTTQAPGGVSRLADVEVILGKATPDNPLAMMAAVALKNSNGNRVAFIPVLSDDPAGYRQAFDRLDADQTSYSVVPYSQDEEVRTALAEKLKELAGAAVMNWKVGWLGYDPADVTVVLDGLATEVAASPATALVIEDANLREVTAGDTLTLTKGAETVVRRVVSVAVLQNTLHVDEAVAVGEYAAAVTRKADAYSKAVEVASVARTLDDPRLRLVTGDAPALQEFADPVPSAYLAAAAAGLRSACAPHQPITRVTLEGVNLLNSTGYTASALDAMAAGGVWIAVRDEGSGSVYTRHQLTTCSSKYNQREDSKITNADEISRFYREELGDLFGRSNISDELIETLYLRLNTVYQRISARNWDWRLGRQITGVTDTVVQRDPDLADRLLVKVSLTTPDPLNNLDVYITIA